MSPPILTATDFSPLAELAAERAALLAHARHRPLHLLHVYNDFAWTNLRALLSEPAGQDLEAPSRDRLRALADELAARHGLAPVATAVATGRAAKGIVARAREIDAGFIVLGAHGTGLMQELAIGGTAIKVLRGSRCPVLVVRRKPDGPYGQVLTATDFSATATRALRVALDTFPDATHRVVHAYSVPRESQMRLADTGEADVERYRERALEVALRRLDAFVADADYSAVDSVQCSARLGHAASVLLEEARTVDLLVVGKHGASALDEQLLGSVTLNVLHHASCDVLLVP